MKKINLVRSLIHLSGFLTIFLRINLGLTLVLLLITVTSIIYCLSEFLRLKGKTFPLIKLTIKAAKDEEKKSFIIKPIYYAIGIASALILFPNSIGNSAIAILTIGDSLAGLSGTTIGKTPIPYNKNKTVEGSLIGFSIAFFAANLFSPMKIALIGAFVGALTESYNKFIEDNLFIPLVSGFIMWISSFFIL
jgi:dolichol kinase